MRNANNIKADDIISDVICNELLSILGSDSNKVEIEISETHNLLVRSYNPVSQLELLRLFCLCQKYDKRMTIGAGVGLLIITFY